LDVPDASAFFLPWEVVSICLAGEKTPSANLLHAHCLRVSPSFHAYTDDGTICSVVGLP